jgi:phage terminase large subunit GpA-like protein
MGDTARREVWAELSRLVTESWPQAPSVDLPLKGLAIDSGFATQEVYAWVRTQASARVFAVKGVERSSALVGLPTALDVTLSGKRLRRGIKVRTVAGGLAKLELFNNLRQPAPSDGEPFPPGYVHLPKVDPEFCKQLCAEQLVTRRDRRGYARREWQKTRERNEALDCYVYARAAAAILGIDRWREPARPVETAPGEVSTTPASIEAAPHTRPTKPWIKVDANWLDRGRGRGWQRPWF